MLDGIWQMSVDRLLVAALHLLLRIGEDGWVAARRGRFVDGDPREGSVGSDERVDDPGHVCRRVDDPRERSRRLLLLVEYPPSEVRQV